MSHAKQSAGGRQATDIATQTEKPCQPELAAGDPNTRRVQMEGLPSFMRDEQTPTGRHLRKHFFDLAAQPYGPGNVSGVLAAIELLRYMRAKLQAGVDSHHLGQLLLAVLKDAFDATCDATVNDESRRWAAQEFLGNMAAVLMGNATHPNLDRAMHGALDRAERTAERWQAYRAADRAEEAASQAKRRPRRKQQVGQDHAGACA